MHLNIYFFLLYNNYSNKNIVIFRNISPTYSPEHRLTSCSPDLRYPSVETTRRERIRSPDLSRRRRISSGDSERRWKYNSEDGQEHPSFVKAGLHLFITSCCLQIAYSFYEKKNNTIFKIIKFVFSLRNEHFFFSKIIVFLLMRTRLLTFNSCSMMVPLYPRQYMKY